MTNLNIPIVWEKLLLDKKRYVTSEDIKHLSHQIGKDEVRTIRYLQEHGYILRIFRELFYVKDIEERERNILKPPLFKIISNALDFKGITNWYFGLETALKFNNMTHEYFDIDYVLTDRYRTTKTILINGSKYQFLKWNRAHFRSGIITRNGIRYSDMEKTILDLSYKRYTTGNSSVQYLSPLKEYQDRMDIKKAIGYLDGYPVGFRIAVGGSL
jgi:predicted transcriptional regulator of viral defense system